MTAQVEFQQGLFDEPFDAETIAHANQVAGFLPDSTVLRLLRHHFDGSIVYRVDVSFAAMFGATEAVTDKLIPAGFVGHGLHNALTQAVRRWLEDQP